MRGPRRWHLPAILRLQSTNRENKWAFKLQRHEVYREGRLPRRLCGAQGPPARHASCALSCLWVVPVCAHTCFSPCGLVILPQGCPPCVLSRPVHCPAVSVAPPPPAVCRVSGVPTCALSRVCCVSLCRLSRCEHTFFRVRLLQGRKKLLFEVHVCTSTRRAQRSSQWNVCGLTPHAHARRRKTRTTMVC